jgi:hypothetical protein
LYVHQQTMRRFERAEGDEVIVSERRQGTFTRRVPLGDGVDTDRIEAAYDHGVLTLTLPVAEQAKARKIAVDGSHRPRRSRPRPRRARPGFYAGGGGAAPAARPQSPAGRRTVPPPRRPAGSGRRRRRPSGGAPTVGCASGASGAAFGPRPIPITGVAGRYDA